MKKDYIVELRKEEADELMDAHWVGELVWCKDCKRKNTTACIIYCIGASPRDDWFCADGVNKDE